MLNLLSKLRSEQRHYEYCSNQKYLAVKEIADHVESIETENKQLKAILKDFLTTKECKQTWISEMQATISEAIGENNNEN